LRMCTSTISSGAAPVTSSFLTEETPTHGPISSEKSTTSIFVTVFRWVIEDSEVLSVGLPSQRLAVLSDIRLNFGVENDGGFHGHASASWYRTKRKPLVVLVPPVLLMVSSAVMENSDVRSATPSTPT